MAFTGWEFHAIQLCTGGLVAGSAPFVPAPGLRPPHTPPRGREFAPGALWVQLQGERLWALLCSPGLERRCWGGQTAAPQGLWQHLVIACHEQVGDRTENQLFLKKSVAWKHHLS